jgi:ATP-dependent RNA helicase HelY
MGSSEVHAALAVIGRVKVPKDFSARSANDRKALAERLRGFADEAAHARSPKRAAAGDSDATSSLRRQLRQHPCHGCAEREAHARWAERYFRLVRDTESLQRRVDSRTTSVARQFDRICDLLLETGYLEGDPEAPRVTASGQMLAGIYSDNDLLVAQAITEGLWDDVSPPELVALAGAVVYEGRQREDSPRLPGGKVRESALELAELARELDEIEARWGVPTSRDLDLGFVWPVHSWAQGGRLATILADSEMAAGDFVRWCRQAIDLLDQIRDAVDRDHPLHTTARRARDLIDRGIVAYSATA